MVVWATCGGVAWYAPVSFTLHMVSHMALAMLAPVLLVLGGPITLALRVIPPATGGARGPREWIIWALHSPATRFVTNPVLVLLLYTVGLYGLYYTDLYATLMSSHLGHFAMQVHFLAVGYLFYWVVIGVDPGPRRLGYPARLVLLHGVAGHPLVLRGPDDDDRGADGRRVVRAGGRPRGSPIRWATRRTAGAIAWALRRDPDARRGAGAGHPVGQVRRA